MYIYIYIFNIHDSREISACRSVPNSKIKRLQSPLLLFLLLGPQPFKFGFGFPYSSFLGGRGRLINIIIFKCFRKTAKSDYYLHRVCQSDRSQGTTQLQLDGFSLKVLFDFFFFVKSVEKVRVSLKSDRNNGHFT